MVLVRRFGIISAVLLALAGCSGGDGGTSNMLNPAPSPGGGVNYTPGVFQPSSSFAARCAVPRAGTSDLPGSVTLENHFLRSWTRELYLWYSEVPDLDPASFTTADYFELLKTSATTASGQPKDKFHFTFDTAAWEALSQSGVEAGYGAQWSIIAATPPRLVVVAYVEPNTPATAPAANLSRGVEILEVDGVDVVNGDTQADVDTLNAGFFPESSGESHTFTIRELNGTLRTVTMISAEITHTPVLNVATIDQSGVPVGYILFNDHIATSEAALANAVSSLRQQSIADLVLDIRYNGGGFLDIASELAYMIGGAATAGRTFERLVFNDQHPSTNPVTGEPLAPTPFHTTTQIVPPIGQPLPTLDLPRVYVITGPDTCSASEAIMNGLRGVGVEVYQIGSTTCGKPYGFYPQDNCGTTYFSIQFQGVNAQDFGDYPDGFSPANTLGTAGEPVPGCSVADDFTGQLGDPGEERLAAALAFRASNNQSCPAPSGRARDVLAKSRRSLDAVDGVMRKSPLRQNRILRDM